VTKAYICHKFESVTFVTFQNVTECHKKRCASSVLFRSVSGFGFGSERLKKRERKEKEGKRKARETKREREGLGWKS